MAVILSRFAELAAEAVAQMESSVAATLVQAEDQISAIQLAIADAKARRI